MSRGDLERKVAGLPAAPGVYLFKDCAGKVLYIGKATQLRDRVRSYLRPGGDGRVLIPFLEGRMADLEFLVCGSPEEALLLEDSLIKRFKPPYNINLKDDKNYLLIRIDLSEEWPRLRVVRRRREDSALYFGPYSSALDTRRTTRTLQRVLQLCDCKESQFRFRTRPCLNHQMGRCLAPCTGLVSREDYLEAVQRAVRILKGGGGEVVKALRAEMEAAAGRLEFERAQTFKERAEALERICGTGAFTRGTGQSRDAFGYHRLGREVDIAVLSFQEGRLAGGERFHLVTSLPDEEVLSTAILRYYRAGRPVPGAVLLPFAANDEGALAAWLSSLRGSATALLRPQRGQKARLLELARGNAAEALAARHGKAEAGALALAELAELLGLPRPPRLIHGFDVSHTQGDKLVASRVAFRDGQPERALYRRFQVRGLEGQDDFAALAQVVLRSLRRSATEEAELPDLVLVDGGAGQVGAVERALSAIEPQEAGLARIALAGIAKARPARRRAAPRGPLPDRLVLSGGGGILSLSPGEPAARLLARVRDEAHRFAITYHRTLRSKRSSVLDGFPGLGPARRQLLLRRFGSLQGLREASLSQLQATPGLPARVAEALYQGLRRDAKPGAGPA